MSTNLCENGLCGNNTGDLRGRSKSPDPCGTFSLTQFFALLWFVSIAFLGSALTATLATIDSNAYQSRGAFLDQFDFQAMRANRLGATGVASEFASPRTRIGAEDSRQRGDLSANRKSLLLSAGQSPIQ